MKKHRFLKILILLLALLAALIYDSNNRIVVTEYTLSSPRLPESFDGFTVAQLSDLHGAVFGEDNAKLLEKLAESEPDIIVITGDMVDADSSMAAADSLLDSLTRLAPVYYVSGNHEWGSRRVEALAELLSRHGARYLRNEYELISRGGDSIVIAGAEDPNGPADMMKPTELVDIINREQEGRFRILLGHRNYWVEKYPGLEVDIIMCGHAHGGIVRLPFAGGVLGTGFELFPRHIDGMEQSGSYTAIISRGLGNSVPVPRFLNNPEIVVLTLESE